MSRLLKFDYDGSLWRYEKEMECEWSPSKVIKGEILPPLPKDDPFWEHRFIIFHMDGHEIEIDAVLALPSIGSRKEVENFPFPAATTVVHLDSMLVGLTRSTRRLFDPGDDSGLTYVEVNDTLLGIPAPTRFLPANARGCVPCGITMPKVNLWIRVNTAVEHGESESIEIEGTKIPGRDGRWQEHMKAASPLGRDAYSGRLIVADGTAITGPWYGNPRDIRLSNSGDRGGPQNVDLGPWYGR